MAWHESGTSNSGGVISPSPGLSNRPSLVHQVHALMPGVLQRPHRRHGHKSARSRSYRPSPSEPGRGYAVQPGGGILFSLWRRLKIAANLNAALSIMSSFCACGRVCKCEVLRRMLLRPRSAKVSTSPGSQRGPDARCMLYVPGYTPGYMLSAACCPISC